MVCVPSEQASLSPKPARVPWITPGIRLGLEDRAGLEPWQTASPSLTTSPPTPVTPTRYDRERLHLILRVLPPFSLLPCLCSCSFLLRMPIISSLRLSQRPFHHDPFSHVPQPGSHSFLNSSRSRCPHSRKTCHCLSCIITDATYTDGQVYIPLKELKISLGR